MSTFEWFLLVVVVILVPLIVAVVITLWTLEQARQRNRQNRPEGSGPAKRLATKVLPPEATETEMSIQPPPDAGEIEGRVDDDTPAGSANVSRETS